MQMLRTIMNKCMKECDRRGASTIVFPAIGTGNLGFPITTAAHIMVDEVCNYLQRNKCKSLSMVYFIIFMENMYRTFCDELETRKQTRVGRFNQCPVQKGIWRLLCGPMKQRWMKIKGQCQDSDVSLTQPSEDERKLTIALKGDRAEVQKLIQEIHQLVKSVEIHVVPLKRPEVRKFFNEGEDGKMKIPHIEKSTKVCIEVCAVGEDMDTEIPGIMNDKEGEEEDEVMKVAEDNGTETELRVYGETKENVKQAVDTLNRLINKQFKTEDYEDERISSLGRRQEKMLRDEARQLQLVFAIDRTLNFIELKGSKDSIAEMKTRIVKILGQVEKEATRKAQAETVMKIVQWKRSDDTTYDPEANLEIEEAYIKGVAQHTITNPDSGEHFTIDFNKMEVIDHAMKDQKCNVKRITEGIHMYKYILYVMYNHTVLEYIGTMQVELQLWP